MIETKTGEFEGHGRGEWFGLPCFGEMESALCMFLCL